MKPVILHIHIPKTAGTSLRSSLISACDGPVYAHSKEDMENLLRQPESYRHSINLAHGHFVYGFHKHLREDYLNLFVVRKPKPRIYSFYRYVCSVTDHPLYKKVNGLTFGEFLDLSIKDAQVRGEINNAQVRIISGIPKFEDNKHLAFAEACRNAAEPTSIVGITEEYPKFLDVLVDRGILPNNKEQKLNVNKKAPEYYQLTDRQNELLEEYTKLDELFYQHCKLVFDGYQSAATDSKFSNKATVNDIVSAYRLILGRNPDKEGLEHYKKEAANGMTTSELFQCFMQSQEYRVKTS